MAHSREAQLLAAPLDPSFLRLSELDKAFLHDAVSLDDAELEKWIIEIQKIAYEKYPYLCIRWFHFVVLMMPLNAAYPAVVERGKRGDSLILDLGCCMGTDVRKLVKDGYPASNVYACDLRQTFIDCGFELYKDRDRCKITFFTDDIFELPYPPASGPELSPQADTATLFSLVGRMTHIYTGALFHLFDEPTQYALALRLAGLLKREPGAVIFGRHRGLEREAYIGVKQTQKLYGHSPESWRALWHRVLSEVESADYAVEHLRVHAVLEDGFRGGDHAELDGLNLSSQDASVVVDGLKMLYWSVHIV